MMRKLLTGLLIGLATQIGYADTKISALSSTTTLNAGDIVPVVTNPGSSPANFSITKTNLNNTLNSWTTPKQSTFTYGLTVGSATVTNLGSSGNICSSNGALTTVGCANGTLTGNQNISVSGDSSGSGTTAITLTAAATQDNITTFTSPITVTSSETVLGAGGLGVTYGVSAGSVTASSITTSGQLTADSILANTSIGIGRLPTMSRLLDIAGSMGLDGTIVSLSFVQATSLRQQSSNAGKPALAIIDASATGNFGEIENDSKNVWDIGYTANASNAGTPVIVWNTSPVVNIKSSMTVEGVGGLNVTYGVVASSVAASSMTASGQITAGSLLLNTPLPVAGGGTGTASPGLVPGTNITSITGTWPNQTINAATQSGGGGGTSAMAVQLNTTNISSPTVAINFVGPPFLVSLVNTSTSQVALDGSSVTMRGTLWSASVDSSTNTLQTEITATGVSTGTLRTTLDAVATSTAAIGVATGTLRTDLNAVSVATGTLRTDLNAVSVATGTLRTDLNAVSVATGTLRTDLNAVSVATGVIVSNLLKSTNTWTAYQNFTSSFTHTGAVYISSTVLLSGAPGTSGQFLTTGGNGAVPTWVSGNAGTITGVTAGTGLAGNGTSGNVTITAVSTSAFTTSTETWTAYQNFTSSITEAGAVYVSSTIILSGSPGASGTLLTSGGNGAVPAWTATSALTNLTGANIASGIPSSVLPSSVAYLSSTNTWTAGQTYVSSVTVTSTMTVLNTNIWQSSNTHTSIVGSPPVLTSCGTNPSVTGSDTAFTITGGATSGGCTATFAQPAINTPTCTVTPQTGSVANTFTYSVSNTAVTFTETAFGTGKADVICNFHD